MRTTVCSENERHYIESNENYLNAAAEVYRRRYFDFIRRTRFAWCWFQSYRESAAMWGVYGNQGVAVKSTVGKLCSVLEKTGREFIYGRMTYVDYRSGVRTEFNPEQKSDYRLLLRPFFLKRREYESENEVRFVTSGADREERSGILLKGLAPKDWISEIRLWPGLTRDEEESIKKAVCHFAPDADCQRSDLFSGPDGPSEFIEMISADFEKSADSNWAAGKDGIPQSLKSP